MKFPISEIFQSLQGEGPAIGSPATFIRLAGCNLDCVYCDTDHRERNLMPLPALLKKVEGGPDRVIITGGEPLLAGAGLTELARAIVETGRRVDIETNGTLTAPDGLIRIIDNYVISPKLSNSGVPDDLRRLAPNLPAGPLKFAAGDAGDLDEISGMVKALPGRDVFVMPLGTDPREMVETMKILRPGVEVRGWRLLPRLHILLRIR